MGKEREKAKGETERHGERKRERRGILVDNAIF